MSNGGLLFNDESIKLRLGPKYNGTTPTLSGTAQEAIVWCREARWRHRLETTDVKGAGGLAAIDRFHSLRDTLELTLLVPNTGTPLFVPTSPDKTVALYWVEVTRKVLSTLVSAGDVWLGVIQELEQGGSKDEITVQRMTINFNADTQ